MLQVAYLSNITCMDYSGRSLAYLSYNDLCLVSKTAALEAGLVVAFLGIITGTLVALYYYFQRKVRVWLYAWNLCLWFVTEEEPDKDKLYDAFISYSHRDEECC
jgi:protein toll